MSAQPRVSVIIPVHNGERFVASAVQSALAQSFDDLEVIVIDDGSTDGTPRVLAAIDDPRLRVVRQENRGPNAARNTGLGASSAPFLALLDADDRWEPSAVERRLRRFSEKPSAGLVYCGAWLVDERGVLRAHLEASHEGRLLERMLFGNLLKTPSLALVRRDLVEHVGGFDESLRWSEDWDLWLRIAAVSELAAVNEPLVWLMDRPDSNGKNLPALAASDLRVLERAFDTYAAPLTELRDPALAHAHLLDGKRRSAFGQFVQARDAFRRARALAPTDWRPHALTALTYFGTPVIALGRQILALLRARRARQHHLHHRWV